MKRKALFRTFKRQQGVAAIWLGLSLVPIMGFTFWAVEGTRYVQEHSRLRDASEAAAIAVTIADIEESADSLTENYVRSYVRDIESIEIHTDPIHKKNEETGELEYTQYTVQAKTTHSSWFASNFVPSFGDQQTLATESLARKYPAFLGDNNIDIVFVSDFSGSMTEKWGSNDKCTDDSCKITDLKKAVSQIAEELLCESVKTEVVDGKEVDVCEDDNQQEQANKLDNRIAFVPFNVRTRETIAGTTYAVSQLRYRDDVKTTINIDYEDVDWDVWRKRSKGYIKRCSKGRSNTICKSNDAYKFQANRVLNVLNNAKIRNDDYFIDVESYVDFELSVADIWNNKMNAPSNRYQIDSTLYGGYGEKKSDQFNTINLTHELTKFNAINDMRADGYTAAFQGVIRGLQILAEGKPDSTDEETQARYSKKIKMLLILSDGIETPEANIFSKLVKAGLCNKARDDIEGLYIGVIGIDFSASEQSGFQDCVENPEDIIDVKEGLAQLMEDIKELIAQGSTGSGITKLY
jgi:tight adherence protein G